MGEIALSVAAAVLALAPGQRLLVAHGVRLDVRAGWHDVAPNVTSECQVGAYRVPLSAAVVVIVGWRTATSGGGRMAPGRRPLGALRAVSRPSFECYAGRGAAAQVVLGHRAYQVNVLVGDRASRRLIAEALAVGRSFDLARS